MTFVSVTQQFNTTTRMGRVTLNILLSFAQFESEVTGGRHLNLHALRGRQAVVPLDWDEQLRAFGFRAR